MSSTPTPFNARALGELVLGRLAEIEYLKSDQRRQEIKVRNAEALRKGLYSDLSEANDKARVAQLSQHLELYAQLADTAARSEHNDVLAAQQTTTRRRHDADEY